MAETRSERKNGNKVKRKKRGLVVFLAIIFIIVGLSAGFLAGCISGLPNIKNDIDQDASSIVYDINGNVVTRIHATENRQPVKLADIPLDLQHAFIATEDKRFYKHHGIDPVRILSALWIDITHREILQGASTITQQLARNAFLSQEQTLKRKVQEALLALQLERMFTKDEILEHYLNQIYFGNGAYGVQAAAQYYFGKDVDKLSLAECAMLAGIPNSPNYYNPFANFKASKERQELVLDNMVREGYISREQADQAKKEEIKVDASKAKLPTERASYFVDYIAQQLAQKYGENMVYKGGLQIYTTLDLNMQIAAENAIQQLMPQGSKDAKGVTQPQAALVAIEPSTGYIKAMVGGRGDDEYNRAVLAERQPGSAFKPFIYTAAIDSGRYMPSTVMEDAPVSFGGYSPHNYDGQYHGLVTLRTALEKSLNVIAVKLLNEIGVDKAVEYAQRMGITTLVTKGEPNDLNLPLALGGLTRGVTPLEMASAFGVLANQGVRQEPIAILKVLDAQGKVLEEHHPKGQKVLNEQTAYIVTDMMRGVLIRGTGTGANIGRPSAGKTGTTSDYRDAWFVGFTPDLVASVWMGYDENGTMDGVTGGSTPASIWRSFMSNALRSIPASDFPMPAGLVRASICAKSGLLATDACPQKDVYSDLFRAGTVPTQKCNIHVRLKVCDESNLLPTPFCPKVVDKVFVTDPKAVDSEEPLAPNRPCDLHGPGGKIVKPPVKQTPPPGNGGQTAPTTSQPSQPPGQTPPQQPQQ